MNCSAKGLSRPSAEVARARSAASAWGFTRSSIGSPIAYTPTNTMNAITTSTKALWPRRRIVNASMEGYFAGFRSIASVYWSVRGVYLYPFAVAHVLTSK